MWRTKVFISYSHEDDMWRKRLRVTSLSWKPRGSWTFETTRKSRQVAIGISESPTSSPMIRAPQFTIVWVP
jgi:hypothetical protein